MRNIAILISCLSLISSIARSQMNWTVYDTLNSILPNMTVSRVCEGQGGVIWAATYKGLVKIDGATWTVYDSSSTGLALNNLLSMAYDKNNNLLWVAKPYYLFRFDGNTWMHWYTYPPNGGYSNDMAVDLSGNVWQTLYAWQLGGGVSFFDGVSFTYYDTLNSQLPDNWVFDIEVSPNNDIWLSTLQSGLVEISSGSNWTIYDSTNSGLPLNYIRCTAFDSSGQLWVVGYDGQATNGYLYSYDGNSWAMHDTSCTVPVVGDCELEIDMYNRKWLGSFDHALKIYGDTTCIQYNTGNSPLPINAINDVLIASDGTVWAGTYGGGLVRIDIPVGIEMLESNYQFQVYPNPTTGSFSVVKKDNGTFQNSKLILYDITSRIVKEVSYTGQQNKLEVNVSGIDSGTYFVSLIESDRIIGSLRIVILY